MSLIFTRLEVRLGEALAASELISQQCAHLGMTENERLVVMSSNRVPSTQWAVRQ